MTQIEANKKVETAPAPQTLPIEGKFARYNSPFLQLMIPMLTTRYMWQALEEINPFNVLQKPNPALKPEFKAWKEPTFGRYVSRNIAALGMGSVVLGVISYYSKKTYSDIHTVYAEAVGYELNKKPEDVTTRDLMKSDNAALAVTRDAFIKRTAIRMAAGASFFLPWHRLRAWAKAGSMPKFAANANAGVGMVGTYLSMDGFIRKQSFFEAEQSLVADALNHSDTNTSKVIATADIEALMLLQRHHLDNNYKWPLLNKPEADEQMKLASRIAELMNQTYHNTEKKEHADFTLGKFNFLIGFGLLDQYPEALELVEIANKSQDMSEIKTVIAGVKRGQTVRNAMEGLPVPAVHEHAPAEDPQKSFAAKVRPHAAKIPEVARNAMDFAATTPDALMR